LHSVVGGSWLFAEDRDVECVILGDQPIEQPLTDHAVADDDETLS
jgi:hypothetical protein